MTQLKIQEKYNLSNYEVASHQIKMYSNPEVWAPYSALEMLNFLTKYGYLEDINNKDILDLGTGTGIVGIVCGLLGANQVTLTDYSQSATELAVQNAKLNGVEAIGVQSDRFVDLEGKIFDFIISNPPVQPWLYTNISQPDKRVNSATWNEAGQDGRLVLDALIKDGKSYLSENGKMVISCSTRHGHQKTTQMLNQYWKNNWKKIYEVEHQIDKSYHQPYMDTWQILQYLDLDLRVYQKDEENRIFAKYTNDAQEEWIITNIEVGDELLRVKLLKQENQYVAFDETDNELMKFDLDDKQIPKKAKDEEWYYKYFLIQADNS